MQKTKPPQKPMPEAALEAPVTEKPVASPAADKSASEKKVDTRSFIERMTGKPDKTPDKPKEGDKPADGKPADGKPAPAAKRKKIDPPAPVATAQPSVDYEKIAEASARGVAKVMTDTKEKETKAKDDVTYTTKEKETIEVLERMEKDYPDEAADSAKRYKEGIAQLKTYRAEWERNNPGAKWDKDAPEHDEFFEKNEFDWDDVLFTRTAARIENEKSKSGDGKLEKEVAELKDRERRREEEHRVDPLIRKSRDDAAKAFFGLLGEKFSNVLDANGQMNRAEIDKLAAEDRLNISAFHAVQRVEKFATELTRLSLTDGEGKYIFPYNEKDETHQTIARFIQDEQARMKSLTDDEQRDKEGRRFLTIAEFEQLPPDQRRYFWHYNTEDLNAIFAAREAQRVKNIIADVENDFETRAKARGYVKQNGGDSRSEARKALEQQEEPAVKKPISPAGTVEPLVAQPSGRAGKSNNSAVSSFEQRWLGRG